MSPYLSGKSAILILVLALTFLLAACGGAESVGTVSSDGQSVSNAAARNDPQSETILVEEGRPDAKLTAETLAKAEIQAQQTDASLPMEKLALGSVAAKDAYVSGAVVRKAAAVSTPVYRFFNSTTGAHFYTSSAKERDNIMASGTSSFRYEGEAFRVASGSSPGLSPVHRFFNTRTGVHFYTISEAERANVVATLPQYRYEGVAYYASLVAGAGLVPMHRFFVAGKGFHFYTASGAEKNSVQANLSATYRFEGTGYYVFGDDPTPPGPENLPLADISALEYAGGFRIPADVFGSSSANYSYGAIAFNDDRNSIYIAGSEVQGSVAEFKIPELVKTTDLSALAMAARPLQNFAKLVDRAPIVTGEGIKISGMFYSKNKLMVNVYRFYDQSPFLQTPTLILEDASNLAGSAVTGYMPFQGGSKAAGWVSPIPVEWQQRLGGTHIGGFTSSTDRALIYNSSVGPSAFAFNPIQDLQSSKSIGGISSTPLLHYDLYRGLTDDIEDLYNNGDHSNKVWTHMSQGSFGMVIPGTRTYMVLGRSGGHEYGIGYGDPPYGGYKGYYPLVQSDVYPYYWFYDLLDLERAKAGSIAPQDLRPYSYGKFNAPFQTGVVNPVAGGSYDKASGLLYLTLQKADNLQGGGTNPPVVVAYKFKTPAAR